MKKPPTFQILESSLLVSRELIVIGEIVSGIICPGDYLSFSHEAQHHQLKIKQIGNLISKESNQTVGLLFEYDTEEDRKKWQLVQIEPQIATILTSALENVVTI